MDHYTSNTMPSRTRSQSIKRAAAKEEQEEAFRPYKRHATSTCTTGAAAAAASTPSSSSSSSPTESSTLTPPSSSSVMRQDHQQQQHTPQHQHHASSSSTRKQSYTLPVSGDLEIATKNSTDEDFGPPIADCLNLGSFAEDSPPRKRHPASSPSDHYHKAYASSYRSSQRQQQQQHPTPTSHHHLPYYGGPSPNHYYPGYYPPQHYPSEHHPWLSPSAYDFSYRRDDESPAKSLASITSTPSKSTTSSATKQKKEFRSPFSSPAPTSSKKPKRSPIWSTGVGGGNSTPSLNMYGSFGMETTAAEATLEGFSPLAPSFSGFGESEGTIAITDTENLGPKLTLAQSSSSDERETHSQSEPQDGQQQQSSPPPPSSQSSQQREQQEQQPKKRSKPVIRQRPKQGTGSEYAYMEGISSVVTAGRILESPIKPRNSSSYNYESSRPVPPLQPTKQQATPTSYNVKRPPFTSPISSSKYGRSRSVYAYHPYDQHRGRYMSGGVRLELGDMGTKTVETRKSLEGINQMVRASSRNSPRNATATPHQGPPPPPQPTRLTYASRLTTPVKTDDRRPSSAARPTPGSHTPHYTMPPASTLRRATATPTVAPPMMVGAPRFVPPSSVKHPPLKLSPTTACKENMTPKTRRNPCNCKKSKCLKLYCECFAAERYCDGCNCTDCHNTKDHEDLRKKAMKDTKAKNPNAFKQKIGLKSESGPTSASPTTHNMGCKCKKSECLKKYCECFQAGIMCGSKCKCVDCLNYAGSQRLIDKRRKMKDTKGAEFAMRMSDEAWKGKHTVQTPRLRGASMGSSPATVPAPSSLSSRPTSHVHRGHAVPPSAPHMMHSPHHAHPTHHHHHHPQYQHQHQQHHPHHRGGPYPHYYQLPPHTMGRTPPVGYGHAGAYPPPYGHTTTTTTSISSSGVSKAPAPPTRSRSTEGSSGNSNKSSSHNKNGTGRPPYGPAANHHQQNHYLRHRGPSVTPTTGVGYGVHSNKRRRRRNGGDNSNRPRNLVEQDGGKELLAFFGTKSPNQPKTTALAVFSFLSNDDLYNAGLVCRTWSQLAVDEELWEFP